MTTQKGLTLLRVISKYLSETNGFDKVIDKVKLVSGGDGKCTAEFKVGPEHLNGGGGLHGGYIATLVDCISTYALMTNEGAGSNGGVSVDIHVSYMKGAREGDDILIEAETSKIGKTLAFLDIKLKKKSTNELIAKGTHTKYVSI